MIDAEIILVLRAAVLEVVIVTHLSCFESGKGTSQV